MSRLVIRISLGILVVLVATGAIVRWGVTSGARHHFEDNFSALLGHVDLARQRLEAAPARELPRELKRLRAEVPQPLDLVDPTRDPLPQEVRARLRPGRPALDFTHRQGWSIYLPVRSGTRVLVIGPVRMVGGGGHPAGVALIAILGVIGLTGFVLAAPLVRRLRTLERTAQRISAGDLEARADLASSKDAIGSLARQFNVMAARVQSLLESQRELIQAVSHELRTPAARIRFGLEMLQNASDEEERQRRIAAIDEDLEELDQLVEELSIYIRSGERALQLERQEVRPADELTALVERLQETRPDVALEVIPPGDAAECVTRADLKLFRRAMQNLLLNGLKHAQGAVAVRLESAEEGGVVIRVSDDGSGIPPADRERVFEPFTRLDASRSRESGGTGLGLAIVKRIVEAHGGTVRVDQADEGGARFSTTWPSPPRSAG
jgi:signal transduction histidine kinase